MIFAITTIETNLPTNYNYSKTICKMGWWKTSTNSDSK